MTPDEARDTLADAHSKMSAKDIAEHALALAMVVASSDQAIVSLIEDVETSRKTVLSLARNYRNLQIAVRNIASLNGSRHFADARKMLSDLAAIEVIPEPNIPSALPSYVSPEQAWPEVYSPRPRSTKR